MDVDSFKGEGFRQYYITKIEELQLVVAEKSQNLRRLQAQRNELNAKGKCLHSNNQSIFIHKSMKFVFFFSSYASRGIAIVARARFVCR